MAKMNQKKFQKVRHQARLIVANVGVPLFLKAQDHKCSICGEHLNTIHITVDHVWPLHILNKNFGNLLLCHYACNQEKADRMPTEAEIALLADVNTKIGYDAELDRYQCRQLLVNKYYKTALWFNELQERNTSQQELDRVQLKLFALEEQIGQWINK